MSSNHYVDNGKFLQELNDYISNVKQAKQDGTSKPRVTEFIGQCILKIATHLAYRPNFNGYTYKDEMISDGIENCLKYIDNFDPTKSSNPFAYFTQIIYYAFIRRIQREKRQTYIKGKIIMEMPFDTHDLQQQDEGGQYTNAYIDYIQAHSVYDDIITKEESKIKKIRPKLKTTLEEYINE